MYFTIFTLIMTITWVSIFVELISILRKKMSILQYFSIYPLFVLLLFCVFRTLLPLELPFTTVITSKKILPAIQTIFCTDLFLFKHLNLAFLFYLIWNAGAIFIAVKRMQKYYYFRRFLDKFPASKNKHTYNIFSKANICPQLNHIKIIIHEGISSPAIVGVIHPIIVLPDINFDDDELLGIFIHETSHYKYKHYIIKFIAEIICIYFWWTPLFYKLSSEIAHVSEMHSDKNVCSILNKVQQKKYLNAIIKVVQNNNKSHNISAFSCSLVEENHNENLQQRFKMILNDNYNGKSKINIWIMLFVIFMFVLSYSFVFQPYSEPTLADYGTMDTNPTTDYYFIKSDTGYDLYDSKNHFIVHMAEIDEGLKGIPIYKNIRSLKTK